MKTELQIKLIELNNTYYQQISPLNKKQSIFLVQKTFKGKFEMIELKTLELQTF